MVETFDNKDNRWKWNFSVTLCGWRSVHFFVHQEYEKSANLCWKLGWKAFWFETLKQMGTMPRKQLVWREASPLLLHIREQVLEQTPKTQFFQWEACKLVQSFSGKTKRQDNVMSKCSNWTVRRNIEVSLCYILTMKSQVCRGCDEREIPWKE